MHILSHKVFPGILQLIISNGMVLLQKYALFKGLVPVGRIVYSTHLYHDTPLTCSATLL